MPSLTLSLHLHQQTQTIQIPRQKVISYQDLIRYVKFVYKDITVNDYDMYINDQHLIYNNDTLFDALTTMKYTHIDIYLRFKKNNIPVIKPTVIRWTDNVDNLRHGLHHSVSNEPTIQHKRYHPSEEEEQEDPTCTRKDSGISLSSGDKKEEMEAYEDEDEPYRKKQRVMSADQSIISRQLPILSPPPPKYNHPLPPHHPIHPLEMRRPSTAPSSPSYSRLLNSPSPVTIKLPALSSITSSPSLSSSTSTSTTTSSSSVSSSILDHDSLFQLAPLQPSPSSSPHKSFYHHHHHHTIPVTTTTSASHSSSISSPSLNTYNYLHSNPNNNGNNNKKSQQPKQTGQFLCEHILDSTTGRVCGQTFRRSYDLSRHQTIHLKNRPFCICDQCGKKFTRMDALRRHERVQGHTSKQHALHRPSPTSNHESSSFSQRNNNNNNNNNHHHHHHHHVMSFINNNHTIQQARV